MPTQDVVLIHGFTSIPAIWDRVIEHLGPGVRAHAIALPGHQGGEPLHGKPDIHAFRHGAAAEIDRLGLERPHVVGNSLGAWTGIELAHIDRVASVLALCPAGFWDPADERGHAKRRKVFHAMRREGRLARPLLPLLLRSARFRRFAYSAMAVHGERLSPAAALASADGMLACTAYPDALELLEPGARRYERFDVPIRVRLGEHDKVFPPHAFKDRIAFALPGADVATLSGVGHLPMIDDPALVAQEIEATVRSASSPEGV